MKMSNALPVTKTAILTIAEIKAATDSFDRGESNVFDALEAVATAVEAYQATKNAGLKPDRRERDAA